MEFSEKELDLLAATYETFVSRTHVFDVYTDKKWKSTGIENWVQTELIVALSDRGYEVSTTGKFTTKRGNPSRGCDIIVKRQDLGLDVGIEIRAQCMAYAHWLTRGIEEHPKANLWLFVTKSSDALLGELANYFNQNGCTEKHRKLNDNWLVMLVKKTST